MSWLTLCFNLFLTLATFHSAKVYTPPKILHHCSICGLDFKKTLEYERHLAGKRHAENIQRHQTTEEIWKEFQSTHWSLNCEPDFIAKLWHNDELSLFKTRVNCLHPTPTVGKLDPYPRARIWRYIRDVMGLSYYSELGAILAAVDADDEGHLRVKELFENLEAFKVISRFILAANRTMAAAYAATGQGEPCLTNIIELAGGHGLLSVLLAYRFPTLQIACYDLVKRNTFNAFLRAFESHGFRRPEKDSVLPNIQFFEEDMRNSKDLIKKTSIVICLHGCGEVNEVSINLAREKEAGWIVMPCCIKKGQYLHENCNVLLEDTMRYHMLCGAMANEFEAQVLVNIDERITNRPVVIAGGIYTGGGEGGGAEEDGRHSSSGRGVDGDDDDGSDSGGEQGGGSKSSTALGESSKEGLEKAVRTRNLPRLQYH